MAKPSEVNPSFKRTLSRLRSIGIDSMCFIYHFEGNEIYGPLVKYLFSQLRDNHLKAVTSALTLAEILSFRKLQKDRLLFEEAESRLRSTPNLTIVPMDESINEAAAILKGKYGVTLPDAIQLATAVITNQGAFVSDDRLLKKVKEIRY